MQFLVGPEVGKDYLLSLVLANGGWLGLAGVIGVSASLLIELYRVSRRTASTTGRALHVGVLALVLGNLMVTTLWAGGATPFVGVPVPALARAGSHLLVLAALLLASDLIGTVGLGGLPSGHETAGSPTHNVKVWTRMRQRSKARIARFRVTTPRTSLPACVQPCGGGRAHAAWVAVAERD
jgi:hypothetical protein